MKQIGSEDARRRFRDLLDDAQAGESAEITRNGKSVAVLMPAGVNMTEATKAEARFTADKADPSWLPRVLHVLARDYPEINDEVWSTAIGENAAEQVARRDSTDA